MPQQEVNSGVAPLYAYIHPLMVNILHVFEVSGKPACLLHSRRMPKKGLRRSQASSNNQSATKLQHSKLGGRHFFDASVFSPKQSGRFDVNCVVTREESGRRNHR